MASVPLLGAHVSTAGGLAAAVGRAVRCGCTTMQIFTKNSNRWSAPPLSRDDTQSYKTASARASVAPVVAHAAYLINPAAVATSTLQRSRAALIEELERCEALGLLGLVIHPGAHMGAGVEEGIKRIAESLSLAHERTPGFRALTILETTAGQGTSVGHTFEQLRAIIDCTEHPERVAVCLDTCHVFAAGHDIRSEHGWNTVMSAFDAVIGISRLAVVHVNDSKRECGSRVDRHDHIGHGAIGRDGFRPLMNDRRLERIPKILETEKSEDMHEDIENLAILRSLIAAS